MQVAPALGDVRREGPVLPLRNLGGRARERRVQRARQLVGVARHVQQPERTRAGRELPDRAGVSLAGVHQVGAVRRPVVAPRIRTQVVATGGAYPLLLGRQSHRGTEKRSQRLAQRERLLGPHRRRVVRSGVEHGHDRGLRRERAYLRDRQQGPHDAERRHFYRPARHLLQQPGRFHAGEVGRGELGPHGAEVGPDHHLTCRNVDQAVLDPGERARDIHAELLVSWRRGTARSRLPESLAAQAPGRPSVVGRGSSYDLRPPPGWCPRTWLRSGRAHRPTRASWAPVPRKVGIGLDAMSGRTRVMLARSARTEDNGRI
ncbi:hypothetical protein SAMN05421678_12412 [Actinopolymorpha cephalotaxi]|uniref:Uncharacterized protein n=1 Tax=Actinopolymorpha cephalotaxi TaxID=504797 RepID=A0A1I3BG78_9ACTN|nr:hypothetical protein [Actinopolymorpha cephalotaxi]SFH61076.1 hypothetical protein SAMN05421678_12412 [Actinopolymorpha cephalotaxi]